VGGDKPANIKTAVAEAIPQLVDITIVLKPVHVRIVRSGQHRRIHFARMIELDRLRQKNTSNNQRPPSHSSATKASSIGPQSSRVSREINDFGQTPIPPITKQSDIARLDDCDLHLYDYIIKIKIFANTKKILMDRH
jgi:hypothetical protein